MYNINMAEKPLSLSLSLSLSRCSMKKVSSAALAILVFSVNAMGLALR